MQYKVIKVEFQKQFFKIKNVISRNTHTHTHTHTGRYN
jgi:hypothetical protein